MSNRNGTQAVMTTILNTMASREGEYKHGVTKNHSLSGAVAERLAPGELDEKFRSMNTEKEDDVVSEEEISAFLAEQKERVKALSINNAKREASIDSFLGAIKKLKQDLENNAEEEQEVDYDACIQNFMKEDEEGGKGDFTSSKFCIQIREALGEKDDEEEDEDIEVLKNSEESQAKYKCCITGKWMEDVVTSKVCKHSYSREGINNWLQNRGSRDCPIAGCSKQVSKNDLEEDAGMQRKVRRMKRKLEAEDERKKKAAVMDDDEDEEE